MPAVAEDILQTRLDLVGLGQYTAGFGQAAAAAGILGGKLDDLTRKQLGMAIGAGAAGLGIIAALGQAAVAADDEAASFQRASDNFKGAFPVNDLQAFSTRLSDLTGIDDGKIASLAGILGTFQVGKGDAESLVLPILNATEALKALGLTAEQVSNQVGKAVQTGEPTALRRSGIILDEVAFKASDVAGRVKLIAAALDAQGGPAAEKFRASMGGAFQAINTDMHNIQEGIGGALAPLNSLVQGVSHFTNALSKAPPEVFGAIALGAGAAAVALLVVSGRLAWSVIQAGNLAGANARLTNETLKAAAAANTQAGALGNVARQMNRVQAGPPPGFTAAGAPIIGAGSTGAAAAAGGGFLSRAGGFLKSPGGVATIAQLGAIGVQMLPPKNVPGGQETKDLLFAGLEGASMGALVGSLGGPIGTAVGVAVGGIAGVLSTYLGQEDARKADPAKSPAQTEAQKQTALLQAQLDELKALRRGTAFDTKTVPGAQQVGVATLRQVIT